MPRGTRSPTIDCAGTRDSRSEGVVMSIEKPPAGTRGTKPPPRLITRLLLPIMQKLHRRSGDRFSGMDLLYLHTVGARSGQPRTSPLARMDDGKGGVLVVAYFGGSR